MFAYSWEYSVHADRITDFKTAYGPEGDWVKLFNQADGYLRTELLEDLDKPGRFVSTDFWDSRQDWEKMKLLNSAEYTRIDQACERLTDDEQFLGFFEVC